MNKLTIGMAVHSDYDGVIFTLQGLRLYHHLKDVELIVVDNDPTSPEGQATKEFVSKLTGKWTARYIPFTDFKGTAATRDLVFKEASSEIVMCIDSHVLLSPGALYYILSFYDQYPGSKDLLQGPLLYEDPNGFSTHFQDIWQSEMWGVWGTDRRGEHPDNPPFEIPGQGLGLFACRKDAWLGFNPHFRGFGGEEMYIHEKFRQAGRKTWCLPGLRWWHRFTRPRGINYPLTKIDKLRNYVLGHMELKLPLDKPYNHFVKELGLSQEIFDQITAEATQLMTQVQDQQPPIVKKKCGCGGGPPPIVLDGSPEVAKQVQEMAQVSSGHDKDQSKTIIEILKDKEPVVEIVDRRSNIHAYIIAANVKSIYSFASLAKETTSKNRFKMGDRTVTVYKESTEFINDVSQLNKVGAAIVQKETESAKWFAYMKEMGADVVILFGCKDTAIEIAKYNTDYTVKYSWDDCYIFTRQIQDKNKLPNIVTKIGNFTKALFKHARNKFGDASPELKKTRYELCLLCPERNNDHCAQCGCPVKEKGSWESEECPLKKW